MTSRARSLITLLLTTGALAAIVRSDGPRSAVVAGAAVAMVLATRIRFAAAFALVVLAVVGGLALDGRGVVADARARGDEQPAKHRHTHAHHRRHRHHKAKDSR